MQTTVKRESGAPIVTISRMDDRVFLFIGCLGCSLNADEAQEWADALSNAAGEARGHQLVPPNINTPAARFMRVVADEAVA
jgi:hypothetical protein